jgi:hypothetical protein
MHKIPVLAEDDGSDSPIGPIGCSFSPLSIFQNCSELTSFIRILYTIFPQSQAFSPQHAFGQSQLQIDRKFSKNYDGLNK